MMPFTAPISNAAARFGQQATNIAQSATSNINQIMLGIAQMRAAGIQENSKMWANTLQQLGVTAQNWPIIQRQMEQADYEKSQRPMRERLMTAQIGAVEARAAENQAQVDKIKNDMLALKMYSQVRKQAGDNPLEFAAIAKSLGVEDQIAPIMLDRAKSNAEYKTAQLNAEKTEREANAAVTAEKHRITGSYLVKMGKLDPKDPNFLLKAQDIYTPTKEALDGLGLGTSSLSDTWEPVNHDKIAVLYDDTSPQVEIDKKLGKEPTAEQKNFPDAYNNWLEAEGLTKNAKNERIYRTQFWPKEKGTAPPSKLLTPEEEAQQIRIAGAKAEGAASAAAGLAAKKMEPIQKQAAAKASAMLVSVEDDLGRLERLARELLVHPGLSGAVGFRLGTEKIPGSAAADFAAKNDALKAQVGFNALQKMRELSRTGGAVGQVSNYEQELFQQQIDTLSRNQSEEQYKKSLQNVIDFAQRAKSNMRQAFESQFGADISEKPPGEEGGNTPMRPKGVPGNAVWNPERQTWVEQ